MSRKKTATKKKTPKLQRKTKPESKQVIIYRNASPQPKTPEPPTVRERFQRMDTSHATIAAGAFGVSAALGILAIGTDVMGRKATAGVQLGAGLALGTAGVLWDSDALLAAGTIVSLDGAMTLVKEAMIWGVEQVVGDDENKDNVLYTQLEGEKQRLRNAAERLEILDADYADYEYA